MVAQSVWADKMFENQNDLGIGEGATAFHREKTNKFSVGQNRKCYLRALDNCFDFILLGSSLRELISVTSEFVSNNL